MKGFVYFASMENGAIKIGFATDVEQRIRSLFYVVPGGVELLASVQGTPAGERWVQAKFAHLKISGEWFRPERELLDFITRATLVGNAILPEEHRAAEVQKADRLPPSDEVNAICAFYLKRLAEPVRAGEKMPGQIKRAAARAGLPEMRAKGIWYQEARTVTAAEYLALREAFDAVSAFDEAQKSPGAERLAVRIAPWIRSDER